jgi:hypothetical protein
MSARVPIIAAGLIVALMARQLMPRSSGLTYKGRDATRYVPLNIITFWLVLGVTAVLCIL